MELQSFFISDKQSLEIFKESKGRIKAMAVLFEKVYESNTLQKVNMNSYIDELLRFTKEKYPVNSGLIKIHTEIGTKRDLNLQEATPFALILNELISNSYKHAFEGKQSGIIRITFLNCNDEYSLTYSDDGIGFRQPEQEKGEEIASLGLNLIDSCSKQLNGKYNFKTDKGTTFNLRFPEN